MDAIRCSPAESSLKTGFTLVELSIVLVIIGLIIGGVLVGRDLISAAAVRPKSRRLKNTIRRSIRFGANTATCLAIFPTRPQLNTGLYPGERHGQGLSQDKAMAMGLLQGYGPQIAMAATAVGKKPPGKARCFGWI